MSKHHDEDQHIELAAAAPIQVSLNNRKFLYRKFRMTVKEGAQLHYVNFVPAHVGRWMIQTYRFIKMHSTNKTTMWSSEHTLAPKMDREIFLWALLVIH